MTEQTTCDVSHDPATCTCKQCRKAELAAALPYFTGSTELHKSFLGSYYTDGIRYLAEKAGAYWLIDLIASHQPRVRQTLLRIEERDFQLWILKQLPKTCKADWKIEAWTDTPGSDCSVKLTQQVIPYSDFPLDEFQCYVVDGTMMLKTEY